MAEVSGSSRPKRQATMAVDYKEKRETDIPLYRTSGKPKRSRRSSPAPKSSHSGSSSSRHLTPTGPDYIPVDEVVPWNWQPPLVKGDTFNDIPNLQGARIYKNVLTLGDGTKIRKGDAIYMICEPPSEPFYIAIVTGFPLKDDKVGKASGRGISNNMFEVLWFYRPRDIMRRSSDSRLLYATVHKDKCPINSFRGFVTVKHVSQIDDLQAYKQLPNHFYFERLYDRYMMKSYDVIATEEMTNLPQNYHKALNKCYPYVFVEVGSGEDLLSSPKNCEKCHQWCPSSDSVQCFECGKSYHLLCVDPPLTTPPKRGFAWFCAPCSKKMEEEITAKRGNMLESAAPSHIMASLRESSEENEEEVAVDDEDDEESDATPIDKELPLYEKMAIKFLRKDNKLSFEERRAAMDWPWRYLGVHVRLEDALDLQDRPYPRASSRLGSKYQCTGIPDWYGDTVVYYDKPNAGTPKKKKRKRRQSPDRDDPLAKKPMSLPNKFEHTDPDEYPGWLQQRPRGYIERGGDDTAVLMWEEPKNEDMVEKYLEECAPVAERLGIMANTPNFVDACLKILLDHNYDPMISLTYVQSLTREILKEPTFSAEEVTRFENSVRIHGDELYPVYKDVGTQTSAMVVRFYYLWKKTKNGHLIWDNYQYRPKNRLKFIKKASGIDLDDDFDEAAYSTTKILKEGSHFKCVYCSITHSVQWFRAPGALLPKSPEETCIGLCARCARLFRRYAVEWKSPEDLLGGYRGNGGWWKKKLEPELVMDCEEIVNARDEYIKHPKKKTPANERAIASVAATTIDGKCETKKRHRQEKEKKSATKKSPQKKPRSTAKKPLEKKPRAAHKSAEKVQHVVAEVKQETPEVKLEMPKLAARKISGDQIAKQMDLRYASKFNVFNPFHETSVGRMPLLQTQNAMQEIIQIWKAYQKVHAKTLQVGTLLPEKAIFDPSSRPCCVCHESGHTEEVVICSNCGLNVHCSCYGVDLTGLSLDWPASRYKWLCDPCSNDLHPIASTHYVCSLCNAQESNNDAGMRGDPAAVPDALKRTDDGHWCHVSCALMSEDILFGDAQTMQPIYGTALVNFHNIQHTCSVCGGNGGGLLKCELCDKYMHVTCCFDTPGYAVGFVCNADSKGKIVLNHVRCDVHPAVVCDKHAHTSVPGLMYGFRAPTKVLSISRNDLLPLISAYSLQKRKPDSSTGAQFARKILDQMRGQESTPGSPVEKAVSHPECVFCHNTQTLRWHTGAAGTVCHQCFVRKANGADLKDTIPMVSHLNEQQLDGSHFGVPHLGDRPADSTRISIRDILS